jgi:hypothetical protein
LLQVIRLRLLDDDDGELEVVSMNVVSVELGGLNTFVAVSEIRPVAASARLYRWR